MITRFAPSPTGSLHLGHAYAAWVAWSEARAVGGQFLFRWEDIDPSRCRPEYEERILNDLAWLGMQPEAEPLRQSARYEAYSAALSKLADRELIYPCFCTRKDIRQADSAPHGPEGPIYPGHCRTLSSDERQARITKGQAYALRLNMTRAMDFVSEPLCWQDQRLGSRVANPLAFGDVVLARKETPTSYHLAVTIDDAFQGVTLVTRGEDLVAATDIHRLLQALLELTVPVWQHHRLICDEQGKRLATRDQACALHTLRKQGITPKKVWDQLGVTGT